MGDSNDEILDQLTCPICMGYPDKEVYQCRNGHPICSSCIPQLENCPQCQVPFGMVRTRCRVMESMLDIVQLPCVNKFWGCTQCFLRKDLHDHHKICKFRPAFLCKWMGFKCDFVASKVEPLIKHLESCHNAQRWRGSLWRNFTLDATFRSIYLQECDPDPFTLAKTWVLLLYTLTAEPNGPNFVSCVPIHLHDRRYPDQFQVHIELFNQEKNCLVSKWTGFPSNYKDAERDFLHPSFRLMTNHINNHPTNELATFDLLLSFRVDKKLACYQPVDELEERIKHYENTGRITRFSTPSNIFWDTRTFPIPFVYQPPNPRPLMTSFSTQNAVPSFNFSAYPRSAFGTASPQLIGVTQQSTTSSNVNAPVFVFGSAPAQLPGVSEPNSNTTSSSNAT